MRWMRKRGNLRQGLLDLIDYIDLSSADMVEIGCYVGESTEIFAKSGKFKKIYAVDPWKNGYDDKDIASKQMSMERVEGMFDKTCSAHDNIQKVKATSSEVADEFEDESIDFVYIDGDHRYEAVKNDIKKWAPKVKRGGYIAGHDYYGKNKSKITYVKIAVDELFGSPEKTFQDNSWIVRKV